MSKEGPHAINGFKGFTALAHDLIMISSINRKLYSINLKGEVVDVIDYSRIDEGNEFSRAVTLSQSDNDVYKFTEASKISKKDMVEIFPNFRVESKPKPCPNLR